MATRLCTFVKQARLLTWPHYHEQKETKHYWSHSNFAAAFLHATTNFNSGCAELRREAFTQSRKDWAYRADVLHLPTLMYVTLEFVALCVENTLGPCLHTPKACSQHQTWATVYGSKQTGLAHHAARLACKSLPGVSLIMHDSLCTQVRQVQRLRRGDAVLSGNVQEYPKEPAGAHVQDRHAQL